MNDQIKELLENNNGQLPEESHGFNFVGYPYIYFSVFGGVLCGTCASDNPEEITEGRIFWEGASVECDECSKFISSAYGDPEAEEE